MICKEKLLEYLKYELNNYCKYEPRYAIQSIISDIESGKWIERLSKESKE